MKKILFFSMLLMVAKTQAQTTPTYEVTLDQMLINISKTTVTSGIIYERVTPFSNLYHYNTKATRNTADFQFFKQALLEMHLASNAARFVSIETLNSRLSPILNNDSSVNMGILNTPFQSINYNETSPSLGRLQYDAVNYKFSASSNTSLPLFNTLHTTVISPLKDVVKGDLISFNWSSNLIFQNTLSTAKKVKNLTVNYGTGTTYTIMTNYVITGPTQQISYPDTGEKQITFTITYSNNTTLTTYAKIKYLKVVNDPLRKTMGSDPNCGKDYGLREHNNGIISDYPFQGYDESFAFKGFIYYDVFYSTAAPAKKILKPIIIIDGFDPGDKRQVLPCDYEPFKYRAGVDRSISEMMKYGDNKEKDLIKELQSKGYDVIIVNQPTYYIMTTTPYQKVDKGTPGSKEIDGGGDYIERNGLNLVTLIKKINTELATNGSAEKLVIVGPSMGGQISRYALAYMEKNNIPHNTRLWVSVDSPHLGANIPLGAQAEISLLKGDNNEAKDFYYKQLGSVAAKQQLIEFHSEIVTYVTSPILGSVKLPVRKVDPSLLNGRTISQGYSTNSGSSFFQNFYNNQFTNGLPNSKGYPMNLRKIALANGSLSGVKTGFDSQQTINVRGFADVCLLLCAKIHVASLEVNSLPSFGNTAQIARYKKNQSDKRTSATNLNSRGNMDIVPGGYFDSYNQLHNSIMGQSGPRTTFALAFYMDLKPEDINLESRTNTKIHSFIPTFSALGIKNPNQDWGQNLSRNLVCSSETPFDSYYGETNNAEHVSFNYTSVDWLFKELGDSVNPPIAQAPVFPIQSSLLVGTNKICLNETATYQLDPCKVPSSVTWSISPNFQIISSNDFSITLKTISEGSATLTATFQNGQKITKSIRVGPINVVTNTIVGPNVVNFNETFKYYYAGEGLSNPATTYNWFIYNGINDGVGPECGGSILSGQGSHSIYLETGCNTGFLIVEVTAKTHCNLIDTSFIFVDVSNPYASSEAKSSSSAILTFPNPMSDSSILEVDVIKTDGLDKNTLVADAKTLNNEVKIYDFYGALLYSMNFNSDKMLLTDLNLKSGKYVLNVNTNSGEILRKVIFVQ